MSIELILILTVIIIGFSVVIYVIKSNKNSGELLSVVKLLQQSSTKDRNSLNERLDRATQVMAGLQRNIGELSEIGHGMKKFQDFLNSPKLRGNIGEHILNDLLAQLLPKQTFQLQYAFKTGAIVDAAITTQNGIIPIDSKFPLESFRQFVTATNERSKTVARKQFSNDVRKHIRDIASKYIVTDEGTVDYALMYIPTEAVYYEIANDPDLFDYASQRRVLAVSPTTFYAYMKAILISLEGQRIEQQARSILRSLRAVQKEYGEVESALSVLNRHLTNATSAANTVLTKFNHLGNKIEATKQLKQNE